MLAGPDAGMCEALVGNGESYLNEMKIEIGSAFILSLPHPIASAVIMALVGPSTLLGAKGGGSGLIYDIPAWIYLIMNLPGLLLIRGWWPESMVHSPVWQVAYCSTLIILNWVIWASITYGLFRMVAARIEAEFESGTAQAPARSGCRLAREALDSAGDFR